MTTHTLRYAARTDRGLLRANNQDSVFAGNRLLVVADGMGGHVAGDTASRLAVAAFAPLDHYDPAGRDLLTPLEHATEDGNEAIADMVTENPELDGMGTTVTALLFDGARLGIAHVGDSRAYLWRAGVLAQITHDDTFVQSLIDEGRITELEASMHPQRSLLLRALNGSDIEPTLSLREARVGDRYLVCSDGLSGVISAEAIADTLASYETSEAADRLIELALRGGGPDNVTVIVADVIEISADDPDDEPMAEMDIDATGPMDDLRFTRRMPRVPLPKEPDVAELAARSMALQTADLDHDELTGIDRPAAGGGGGRGSRRSGRNGDRRSADPDDGPSDRVRLEAEHLDENHLDDDHPDDDDHLGAAPLHPRTRTRVWARRAAYMVAVLILLVVGGILGINWVGNQYFVGDDNGQVTIFRGVDGSILGIGLSSAQEDSCFGKPQPCQALRLDDLTPAARDQVVSGIAAADLPDARQIISRLAVEVPCPPAGPGAALGPQSTPSVPGAASTSAPATAPSDVGTATATGGTDPSTSAFATSGPSVPTLTSATAAPGTGTFATDQPCRTG
jgi:PPM family protein phosphatase